MPFRQHAFEFRDLTLACQISGSEQDSPVIALHGWQDNSASFTHLASQLPNTYFIAPDLAGHGLSSWRHAQAGYYIWSYLEEILALADSLGLSSFTVLGHSMGGVVATLLAALFPDRINKLILLDAIGPLVTDSDEMLEQMRTAIGQHMGRDPERRRYYSSMAAAVTARAENGVELHAAELLATRGVGSDANGFYWRHDPRLRLSNLLSLTEEQSEAFMRRVSCPVQLIAAASYWQQRMDFYDRRIAYFNKLSLTTLKGGHHQHMEDQADQVASFVNAFLFNA